MQKIRHFQENYPFVRQLDFPTSPLIKILPDGNILIAQSRMEKMELIETWGEGERLVMIVPGQWRSDVFEIIPSDVADLLTNK